METGILETGVLSEKEKKLWISPSIVDLSIDETAGGLNAGSDYLEQS